MGEISFFVAPTDPAGVRHGFLAGGIGGVPFWFIPEGTFGGFDLGVAGCSARRSLGIDIELSRVSLASWGRE